MAAICREQLIGEPPSKVEPLRIVAQLAGPIVARKPIALDGLLMKVHAWREQLQAPVSPADVKPIEIPVQHSDCGQFHLCSFSVSEADAFDLRYKNRRPPIQEYLTLGASSIKRVDISVSVDKMYRVPYSSSHLKRDELTWYALGDAEMIRALLMDVHYLGKHTGWGSGKVAEWTVESCETWDGFPIIRDGKPLRNLPSDYPGLDNPRLGYCNLTPPYWMRETEALCATP